MPFAGGANSSAGTAGQGRIVEKLLAVGSHLYVSTRFHRGQGLKNYLLFTKTVALYHTQLFHKFIFIYFTTHKKMSGGLYAGLLASVWLKSLRFISF